MFKKTLIAAAVVATTATFGASASTVVSTSPATIGVEYAVGMTQITSNDVKITTGRDFNAGDIIAITFSGATVASMDTASTPAAIVPTLKDANGVALTGIEFLEYSGNTVKLLITSTSTVPAGLVIYLGGVQLVVSNAADGGLVKASAAGKVSTVEGPKDVDISTAATLITFADELSTSIMTKYSGVVDVNSARKKFTTGVGATSDSATSDTLVLSNTVATVSPGVTTTGATYTVWGDFSFLDGNGDGAIGNVADGSVSSAAGTVTYATDFSWIKVKNTSALSTGTVGITINAPGTMVIPDQSFMAQADVSYTDPAGGTTDKVATTLAKSAAGSWTLNGSKSHIPFLPFSAKYSQSVTISNTSSQTGGVDLVVYTGTGAPITMSAIATANANGVTDISAAVRTAVANAGLSGNLAMDVIVNAPSASITTTAIYYTIADKDRVLVK